MQPIAQHLLGKTVVVDDLADAVELHATGPRGYRYVTHAGEVLEADGTLRAGPLTAAMGLLSRRSELEAIAQQIAEVDRRIAQLTDAADRRQRRRPRRWKSSRTRCATTIYQANTAKVELTSQIAQNNDSRTSLQPRAAGARSRAGRRCSIRSAG